MFFGCFEKAVIEELLAFFPNFFDAVMFFGSTCNWLVGVEMQRDVLCCSTLFRKKIRNGGGYKNEVIIHDGEEKMHPG